MQTSVAGYSSTSRYDRLVLRLTLTVASVAAVITFAAAAGAAAVAVAVVAVGKCNGNDNGRQEMETDRRSGSAISNDVAGSPSKTGVTHATLVATPLSA